MQTKSVMLTEDEIANLLMLHGENILADSSFHVERINYLSKRLKAFKEPEVTEQIKSDNSAAGWSSNAQTET